MFSLLFVSVSDIPCLPGTDVSQSEAALAAEMISKSVPSAGWRDKEAGYSSALLTGQSVESEGYHYNSKTYKCPQFSRLHCG